VHQIYTAAILTTGIAPAIFGTMIRKLRLPANERLLWVAILMVLPMEPLASRRTASGYFTL
jgi:hypothetical protein